MAYIGKGIENLSSRTVLDNITTSATDTYNLLLNSVAFVPSSAESLTVSLNGVIQRPQSSYSVSGGTIVFASTLSASDSIDFILAERAITLTTVGSGSVGTSQLADTAVTTAKIADDAVTNAKVNDDLISGATELTSEPADTDEFLVSDAGTLKRIDYSLIKASGGGITEADQWRLTTNMTSTGNFTNVERVDTAGGGYLGTGMTESSGVFTFPSTGIWLITLNQLSDDITRTRIITRISSTDTTAARIFADNSVQSGECKFLYDVTSTSTHKILFNLYQGGTLYGNTSENYTNMTFIRMGDT